MIIDFKNEKISKGELADRLYNSKGVTYDCAIPHFMIVKIQNRFSNEDLLLFGNLSSHFVWLYDDNDKSEYLAPLTSIGCKILGVLALGS
jgi:hypothetical protein